MTSGSVSGNSLVDILDDLELQRDEVIGEIKKAPHRRVDNLITTLYDSTRMLRTHVVVAEAAPKEKEQWRGRREKRAVVTRRRRKRK